MVGEKINPAAEELDRFSCLACGTVIDLSGPFSKGDEAE
jgi:hypothetical protein